MKIAFVALFACFSRHFHRNFGLPAQKTRMWNDGLSTGLECGMRRVLRNDCQAPCHPFYLRPGLLSSTVLPVPNEAAWRRGAHARSPAARVRRKRVYLVFPCLFRRSENGVNTGNSGKPEETPPGGVRNTGNTARKLRLNMLTSATVHLEPDFRPKTQA